MTAVLDWTVKYPIVSALLFIIASRVLLSVVALIVTAVEDLQERRKKQLLKESRDE